MKHLMSILAMIILVGAIGVTTANAQKADTIKATIPFAFTISNRTFPAGDYSLRRSIEGAGVVMQLTDEATNERVYVSMHAQRSLYVQTKSKLVFNRYGDQYFLSQVWIAGRSEGNELRKTQPERTLQRELARKQTKPETIDIASKDVRQR